MSNDFHRELRSAILARPQMRPYDYAMILGTTESRVNTALRDPSFARLIRKGKVATHNYPHMKQPQWFLDQSPSVQRSIIRTDIGTYTAEPLAINRKSRRRPTTDDLGDISALLQQVSKRGVSAYAHRKRIFATQLLGDKVAMLVA